MTQERPKKLKGLDTWMQHTTDSFSGVADADTAVLTSYSHDDHTLYTANIDLETGTVEWTSS